MSSSNGSCAFLSLPNELLRYHIFVYLDPTELLESFGSIRHHRLRALLSTVLCGITHVDLAHARISNQWILSNMPNIPDGNKISTVQINHDQVNEATAAVFLSACPKVTHLDVNVQHQHQQELLFSVLTTMKLDSLTLSSSKYDWNEIFAYVCNSQCTLRTLKIIGDEPARTLSVDLLSHCNCRLTHLSLAVLNLDVAASLMPYVPALEKLELYLPQRHASLCSNPREYRDENHRSSGPWSTRVRFLSIVAPKQYTRTTSSFYDFVRRFALSLERLSFYLTPIFSAMTSGDLERELLTQLPRLMQLDFCVHTGLTYQQDNDARHRFDHWATEQRHVISIFHRRGRYHTRFTLPFVFDRLEMVDTSFLDYHSNISMAGVLQLSNVRHISFYCVNKRPLSRALLEFIHCACPRLKSMHLFTFTPSCLSETVVDIDSVPSITFQSITRLQIDHSSAPALPLRRLLELIPHLEHLILYQDLIKSWCIAQKKCDLPQSILRLVVVQREDETEKINIDHLQSWLPSRVKLECPISIE